MMPRFLEVARQAVLLNLRGRVFQVLLGLTVVSAILLQFLPLTVRGSSLFESVGYLSQFFTLAPFVTLFLAAQAVAGDLEDRTSVFLFTRSISRVSLLVGKWLAVVVLGSVFVGAAITTLYVSIAFGPREWLGGTVPSPQAYQGMLVAGLLAVIGYAAVGSLLASFFRRPMLIGVLYVFLEQFISRLPPQVPIHHATIAFPARVYMYQHMDTTERFARMLRGMAIGNRHSDQVDLLMGIEPWIAVLKVTVVCLGLALWIYTRREYDSRPRE